MEKNNNAERTSTPERNNTQNGSSEPISFTVLKHLGVLSTSNNGWSKEVNLVVWNGGKPKYDIRDWSPDHEKMTKGLRITPFEAKQLRTILDSTDLDQPLPDAGDLPEGLPQTADKAAVKETSDEETTPDSARASCNDTNADGKEEGIPF